MDPRLTSLSSRFGGYVLLWVALWAAEWVWGTWLGVSLYLTGSVVFGLLCRVAMAYALLEGEKENGS